MHACLWQGVWFNDVPRIFTLFHGLVTGDDDCGLVTFNPPTIKGSCKNGEVGHSLQVTTFESQPSSHSFPVTAAGGMHARVEPARMPGRIH